jgi:hypothetical protein
MVTEVQSRTKVVESAPLLGCIFRGMRRPRTLISGSLILIALVGAGSAIGAKSRFAISAATAPAFTGAAQYVPSKVDRVAMAEDLEQSLLKEGHDIRIKAQGKDGKTLTVKWSLMGASFVYSFSKDDRLIRKLQDAGFNQIHFDNGDRFWDQQIE